jgi:hypothetical protein
MGKLVFIPVFYTGLMKDILYVIYKMGDPFDLDPQDLVNLPIDYNISSNRGKITLFEEYSNILQSFPLMSLILFIVLCAEGLVHTLEYTFNKKFAKSRVVQKVKNWIKILVYLLIEMNLVDYVFYASYNIHQMGRNTQHGTQSLFSGKNISLFVSCVILSRIAFTQVKMLVKCLNMQSRKFNPKLEEKSRSLSKKTTK